ncbi:cytochrome P450 [Williamsia phyllosphaerae]|uniref:Cytochrome P450 n=1 Tax=Williamsia phyllosphaerae TaxID=885042 RepID=A0ABQ1UXY5_9NOCA|nr:cytochrome P450 [Williamsia phyllosphaerae]GGF29710.1 cytochrome P450 [Williamsia phyllosphaerae]
MTQTIHRPDAVSSPPLVVDIPRLDTPHPYVRELPSDDGHQHIELPSGHTAICLTSHVDVKTLMLDRTASRALCNVDGGPSFMPTNWAPEVLINLDAPVHGVVREFVSHEFSARAMAGLEPTIRTLADAAFDALDAAAEPDIMTEVFRLVPAQVVCTLLGISRDHAPWMNELGRRIQLARRDEIPLIVDSWIELYGWVQHLVADESDHDDTGLLATYKRRARQPEFAAVDDTLISGTVMGIVLGGDNNVATMLVKTLYAALAHRDLYAQVVDDPALVPDLVEEIMRLMPLGTPGSFPRELTRPLDTSAGTLPAGAIVYPHINAANRDPAVFDSPLEIRLDRPRGRHLQYGYGMHRCMGSALAQTELIAILTRVVTRYPDLALRVAPSDVEWDLGTGLRRPAALPVDLGARRIV